MAILNDRDSAHLVAGKYAIEDLVDLGALERLFKKFSAATGFTTGFLAYPSQKVLIKTGWHDACAKFHRACPASVVFCKESNVELSQDLKRHRELRIRQCRLGLVDGATPIIVRGVFIAYLSTGQVFFQPPDLNHYRKIARQFGFDEAQYLQAIQAIPIVTESRFRATLNYLSEMATLIAKQGLLRIEEQNAQLHESETRFRTLFDAAADGIFLHDFTTGRINLANKICLDMLGYTLKEFIALGVPDLHLKEDLPRIRREITRCCNLGTGRRTEQRFRRRDGSLFYAEVHPAAVRLNGHDYVLVLIRDITERRQLQAEVEHESEVERQTLGRDLHDGLSQHLAAIALHADSLESQLNTKGFLKAAEVGQLAKSVREALTFTRDLSRSLYPNCLEISGLPVALEELALQVNELFSISCRCRLTTAHRLADTNLERQLFRIAQEAAFNAGKHSQGQHVWIALHQTKGLLTLTIRDDGAGVFPAKPTASNMGLKIMHYRANLIGAVLTIDAKRGHGTTIRCKLRTPPR